MADGKTLKQRMEEAKMRESASANETRQKYEGKALEFSQRISSDLNHILEGTNEVRKINTATLATLAEEHEKRQAIEKAKSQALSDKTAASHESVRRFAFELQTWIEDMVTVAEAHNVQITESESRFRSKLEDLKKNAPEEAIKKAEEHKFTLEASGERQKGFIAIAEQNCMHLRQKIASETSGTNAQLEDLYGKTTRQVDNLKRELSEKMRQKDNEIHAELTRVVVDLGLDRDEAF